MSKNQIMEWLQEREGMKKRDDYFDIGNKTQHIVRYENGDSYQHIEVYQDIMHKTTETILNNETVLFQRLKYVCFGWEVVA